VNDNDIYNGVPAVLGTNVTITNVVDNDIADGVTLDPATGQVSVTSGAVSGNYTIDYTICSIADPSVCDIATVTVNVTNLIIANDDINVTPIGSMGAVNVLNIADNDVYRGQPVTPSEMDFSVVV